MRSRLVAAITGAALAAAVPAAHAQQSGFTPQQLDQMSRDRSDHSPPRNYGPPVPQSLVPADQLHQPTELLECMGTTQWQPIHAAPSADSRVIGRTLSQVAVGGPGGNGFSRVLNGAGRPGYVPTAALVPYRNQFNPALSCTVKGLRANGAPVFAIK